MKPTQPATEDPRFKTPCDLTTEITITNFAPAFVGTYSHIFKGSHKGRAVSTVSNARVPALIFTEVAIKVLRDIGSMNTMNRVICPHEFTLLPYEL
jgi:hypothetical protein